MCGFCMKASLIFFHLIDKFSVQGKAHRHTAHTTVKKQQSNKTSCNEQIAVAPVAAVVEAMLDNCTEEEKKNHREMRRCV